MYVYYYLYFLLIYLYLRTSRLLSFHYYFLLLATMFSPIIDSRREAVLGDRSRRCRSTPREVSRHSCSSYVILVLSTISRSSLASTICLNFLPGSYFSWVVQPALVASDSAGIGSGHGGSGSYRAAGVVDPG